MYNVFYDISVEQWMLQTRIKSKVMLAASLMNEEGIYGGEEAITTSGSKKELSATLQQTKLDEMWDFLSFLRAAPTARNGECALFANKRPLFWSNSAST